MENPKLRIEIDMNFKRHRTKAQRAGCWCKADKIFHVPTVQQLRHVDVEEERIPRAINKHKRKKCDHDYKWIVPTTGLFAAGDYGKKKDPTYIQECTKCRKHGDYCGIFYSHNRACKCGNHMVAGL